MHEMIIFVGILCSIQVCRKWCSTISGMAKSALFNRSTHREEIMRVLCSFPSSMETISLTDISGDIAMIMRKLCKYVYKFRCNTAPILC